MTGNPNPLLTELLMLSGEMAAPRESGAAAASDVLRAAMRAMRSHFGMEVAFVSEFVDGRRVIRTVEAQPGTIDGLEGRSDPLEETYCQRILDGRLPPVLQDAQRHPEAARIPATAQLPVRAHLGVPLRFQDGAVYGTFCCFSRQPDRTLNARDEATLQLFGRMVAGLVEQEIAAGRGLRERAARVLAVLDERRLRTAYQPIVDVESGTVHAFEALARFDTRGPAHWFAEACAVGLQAQLEGAAITQALPALSRLPPGVSLSLNVSPSTLLEPGFAALLAHAPLPRVMLEVTEHACIEDYDSLARAVEPLRAAGVKLAVDDAGAGFASFRHILRLRPDVIKLDASLIRHIHARAESRALAAALIRFAEETGCGIVAEGVEEPAELEVLRHLGVRRAQGYLLGRPAPLEAAVASCSAGSFAAS